MTSHSGFTVVEEHNFRQGDATSDEIEQCVLDISTWFSKNSSLGEKGSTKPSKEDIQSLSKTLDADVPEALQILLFELNGSVWFMEKEGLSLQEITKVVDSGVLPARMIPFARDLDDNMLVIDSTGAVREWSEADGGDVVSKSLPSFLEKFRNDLLSGHYEYVEEIGVVEKAGASRAPAHRK